MYKGGAIPFPTKPRGWTMQAVKVWLTDGLHPYRATPQSEREKKMVKTSSGRLTNSALMIHERQNHKKIFEV
jgi:hypothetical protein